jgi:uncharacterized protein (TIGR02391 family)
MTQLPEPKAFPGDGPLRGEPRRNFDPTEKLVALQMPSLNQLIPEVDVLCALEPDELGLRMLPALATWSHHDPLTLHNFVRRTAVVDSGPVLPSHYPLREGDRAAQAIREAWAWLEGQALLLEHPGYRTLTDARILSRKAARLAEEPAKRRTLPTRRVIKETLHSSICEDVWGLYHRGKYDTAVFEAMKAVEVAVRGAAGLPAADIGTKLMRKAFDVENGPLTDKTVEQAERQARSDLFAGAIGSYKNPHSHRNVALDDPDEAAEIIMLANHLLRIVDSRRGTAAGS